MKLFILLFSFCLVAGQPLPAKKMSDREHEGFIGPVKSVYVENEMTEQNYGGPLTDNPCRKRKEIYDLRGRLTKLSAYYGLCGENENIYTYKYAADGSRTRKDKEIRDPNSPPETITFVRLVGTMSERFRYDSAGKLVETSYVIRSRTLIRRFSYEYDSAGRLIETRTQRPNSEDSVGEIQTYEGNNKAPSTYSSIGSGGRVLETRTYSDYEFNPQGDWIKRQVKIEELYDRKQTLIETRKIEYYNVQ